MSRLFTVVYVDPDDASEATIGELELASDGLLEAIRSEEGCGEFFQQFIDSLNAKASIQVKIPSETRYSVSTRTYERDSPDFVEGMKQYVKHYYSIELRSQDDFDQSDDFADL